ncbi:hypothetical protein AB0F77_12665 [Streptomyces sp. NPDC026672]|uniref:hypothetical protein n=1 Tax=unclassified Streptomyces TaxID=2593676 RepID=UPI0033E9746D
MIPSRFLYVVRGAGQRPRGDDQAIGWRLVGSNHRELGRSAETFDGFAECRAAVLRLRRRIADVKVLLSAAESVGGWSWALEMDDRTVAVAGRRYQRQRDCQYNLGQFLNAVPVAELTEPTTHHRQRDTGTVSGAGGTRPYGSGRTPSRTEPRPAARPVPGALARPAPGAAGHPVPPGIPKPATGAPVRPVPPGVPEPGPDTAAGRPATGDGDGSDGTRGRTWAGAL